MAEEKVFDAADFARLEPLQQYQVVMELLEKARTLFDVAIEELEHQGKHSGPVTPAIIAKFRYAREHLG